MNFILLFTICTIVIVILGTIKSIVTIRGSKFEAALVCALTQGFNIYIVFLTACDELDILPKILITIVCNLIGVWIVKHFEDKIQKEKLWKIEFTVPSSIAGFIDRRLDDLKISHSYICLSDRHSVFNCYCETKDDSKIVKALVGNYNAKWFVSESKSLF